MPTSKSINAAVASLTADLATVGEVLTTALQTGTQTDRQLQHVIATLAGLLEDLADIRTDLDALDVTDLQLLPDAKDTIILWTWERGVRRELVRLNARIRQVQATASSLVTGQDSQTHVVRSGETLQTIAAKHLGDWREWPRIAALNKLAPGQPASGTVLTIPPRR